MPNETAHVVGYMWYPENEHWGYCGCLTWFGDFTYVFKMADTNQKAQEIPMLHSTRMACFNNVDRTIKEDDAVYIFQKRKDRDDLSILSIRMSYYLQNRRMCHGKRG